MEHLLGKFDSNKVSKVITGKGLISYISYNNKNFYFLNSINDALDIPYTHSVAIRKNLAKNNIDVSKKVVLTGLKKGSGNPKKTVLTLKEVKEYINQAKIDCNDDVIAPLSMNDGIKIEEDKKPHVTKEKELESETQNRIMSAVLNELDSVKHEVQTLRTEMRNVMNFISSNDTTNEDVKKAIDAIYKYIEQPKSTDESISDDYINTYSLSSVADDKNISVDDCIEYLIDAGFIFKNDDDIYMLDSYKKYGKSFIKFDRNKGKYVKYVRFTNDGKYLAEDIISGIINQ